MKRNLFLLLYFGCFLNFPILSQEYNLQVPNLKGMVKDIIEKEYNVVERFDKIEKTDIHNFSEYYFNEDGFVTRRIFPKIKEFYQYRESKLYRITRTFDNGDGDYYDIISDGEGNLIEETSYDSKSNNIKLKRTFSYENGQKSEMTVYSSNEEFFYKINYIHDGDGILRSMIIYDKNKHKESETRYLYYDQFRNVISESFLFKYLDSDKEESSTNYTHVYKYDNHDNWYERNTYENGKIYKITEREISYY